MRLFVLVVCTVLFLGAVFFGPSVSFAQEKAVVEETTEAVVEESPEGAAEEVAAVEEEAIIPIEEISGKVVSVDQANATIVVKHLKDKDAQVYEDVAVSTNSDTIIEKDYQEVALADVSQDNEIAVECITKDGKKVATYILVK